jgi:hypothetical protein
LATCVSLYAVERRPSLRIVSALGILVSLSLVLMKFIPEIPGHFTTAEWIALAAWLAIGLLMHVRAQPAQ